MPQLNRITLVFIALLIAAPVSAADTQKDLDKIYQSIAEELKCTLTPDPNNSDVYYSAECKEKRKREYETKRKRKLIQDIVTSAIAVIVIILMIIVFRKRRRIAEGISNRWRRRSKAFRAWVFGSFFWAVGVLLFVLLVEPYRFRYGILSDHDLLHMFSVMIVPPIFFGAAWFGYKRFVK
ncbi:hypothetical protein N9748_00815 [bacterium]|nr:hypothetical protein [bacterium]